MTYVMSDIHGKYSLFLKMLEEIRFSDNDVLYVAGDFVDLARSRWHFYAT